MKEKSNMTICSLLQQKAYQYPDKEYLVFQDNDKVYTYSSMLASALKVAKSLIALNVKKGDIVLIWCTNTQEAVEFFFGATLIGVVPALLSGSVIDTANIIDQLNPKLILIASSNAKGELIPGLKKQLEENRMDCSIQDRIITLKEHVGFISYSFFLDLSAKVNNDICKSMINDVVPDDDAYILFTSGSTGQSKGVTMTHKAVVDNSYEIGMVFDLTQDSVLCLFLPIYNCFGITGNILASLSLNAKCIVLDHFNPVLILETIEKYQCTMMATVPGMLSILLSADESEKFNISSLNNIMVGGDAIPSILFDTVAKRFPKTIVQTGYGMSEFGLISASRYSDPIDIRMYTVGRPVDRAYIRIEDLQTRNALKPKQQGEICVLSASAMKEYFQLPKQTQTVFTEDGYIKTGDVGFLDEQGNITITGRIKELIIRGGENIAPKTIENIVMQLSFVKRVAAIGVDSEILGQEICCCIIPDNVDTLPSKEEICNFIGERLPKSNIPKYVVCMESFPLTSTGKCNKPLLSEKVKSMI